MIDFLQNIIDFIETSGTWGAVISCALILIESIVPVLPLLVFITINFMVFGNVLGFIISWVCTLIGCVMSYYLFKNGLGKKFEIFTENKELIKKYTKLFKNISTGKLVLIIGMPFTPAFMVNIVAGLTKMDFKKYFTALVFGKISLVFYSAYIGMSFVESIKNPIMFVKMFIVMGAVYLLYRVLNKVLKLE